MQFKFRCLGRIAYTEIPYFIGQRHFVCHKVSNFPSTIQRSGSNALVMARQTEGDVHIEFSGRTSNGAAWRRRHRRRRSELKFSQMRAWRLCCAAAPAAPSSFREILPTNIRFFLKGMFLYKREICARATSGGGDGAHRYIYTGLRIRT